MGFWCRIKQSNLTCWSHQVRRCYLQIHGPCLAIHTASSTRNRALNNIDFFLPKGPTAFGHDVRFFAAPVQVKPKQGKKDVNGPRINEKIKADVVRVVTDEGHFVVSRYEALKRARQLELDLVEVQRSANPPVCKIMDFNKEKYKQKIKKRELAKSKSESTVRKGDSKEVRFSGKTDLKDLQIKADMIKRLMERRYRVKCTAVGTEDQDLGELLSRLAALIEDVSFVESGPWVEKKQAYMVVRHIKFGPSKKGAGKKASKAVGATSLPPNTSLSSQSAECSEEDLSPAESESETEDNYLYDDDDAPVSAAGMPDEKHESNQTSWSVSNAGDDFDQVFDISSGANDREKTGNFYGEQKNDGAVTPSSPADLLHRRLELDSTRAQRVPAFSSEPPRGAENRYRRREPSNRIPATKPMDNAASSANEPASLEPQFLNQGKQLLDLNGSPSTGDTKRLRTNSPAFQNSRLPNEIPSRGPSHPGTPSSSASGYGIFSVPKANGTGRQGIASDVNMDKERSTDFGRDPSPRRVPENLSLPSPKSNEPQGKWGIFSRDGNVQPKVQR